MWDCKMEDCAAVRVMVNAQRTAMSLNNNSADGQANS